MDQRLWLNDMISCEARLPFSNLLLMFDTKALCIAGLWHADMDELSEGVPHLTMSLILQVPALVPGLLKEVALDAPELKGMPEALTASFPVILGSEREQGLMYLDGSCAGLSYSKLSLILRYLALTYRMLKEAAPDAPELRASDPEIEFIVDHLLGTEREPPPFPAGGPRVRHFIQLFIGWLSDHISLH